MKTYLNRMIGLLAVVFATASCAQNEKKQDSSAPTAAETPAPEVLSTSEDGIPKPETVGTPPAQVKSISGLDNKDACFLLYDFQQKKVVKMIGTPENCKRRLTACSTFKLPVALMAFDSKTLKEKNTLIKWSGIKWPIDSWNRDQTAATWMKNSVVWYTQDLMPKIGMPKVKKYLRDFKYGNQNMSSGIQTSWLTSAPYMGNGPKGSLKISAREQLEFMKRLWLGQLKLNKRAIDATKKITFLEKSPKGYIQHGKTGSGFTNADQTGRIGWFISHINGPRGEYVSILNFTDTVPAGQAGYAGLEAREATKAILTSEGLW